MVTHPAAVSDTLIVSVIANGPLLPPGAVAPASDDIHDQDDEPPTQNQQPTYLDQDSGKKMKQQRSAQSKKSALATRSLPPVPQVGLTVPLGPSPNQQKDRSQSEVQTKSSA